MSSIATPAEGGRVWNEKQRRLPFNPLHLIPLVVIIILVPVITLSIISAFSNVNPTVTSSTSDELKLNNYTRLNLDASIELTKDWLPKAFNVNPESITKTILPDIREGTLGVLTLKDGTSIAFTIHEKDGNITVTKE